MAAHRIVVSLDIRTRRTMRLLLCALLPGLCAGSFHAAEPPQTLRDAPGNEGSLVALPDGTLQCFYMVLGEHVASIASKDQGQTWSEPKQEFAVVDDTANAVRALLDRDGTLHLFYLQRRAGGEGLPAGRYLDIWHARRRPGQPWDERRRIWDGYCGALRGAAQMADGRLLLPFGAWRHDAKDYATTTGSNYTTLIYSDDGGDRWSQSAAQLTSPVTAGYNGANYGAIEPAIVPLADGRVWMLLRTQTGYLYESFSRDGVTWSEAAPTPFASSNSPATLLRLKDQRLLLIFNHCQTPPRVDGAGVYGGRDAIHAAISDDDGRTWRGFREIYRDPTRNDSPPKRGDRGTAYADAIELASGAVRVMTGQGRAATILLLDPDWLLETRHRDDFSAGLDGWSTFKSFGPAKGWWRDRTAGPELISHPDKPGRKVLRIARPVDEQPDGAVWNFPAGKQATVTLRVRRSPGFQGATIALADRFFDPTDPRAAAAAIVRCKIEPDGRIGDGKALSLGTWHEIKLVCQPDEKRCDVMIDGKPHTTLTTADASPVGISYLRLLSEAASTDEAGLLVEHVAAEVSP